MTSSANTPVSGSERDEAAFMRAFYWKVAKIVLLVVLGLGLLWLSGARTLRPALQSLGGGLVPLIALKSVYAVAVFGFAALLLRLVFFGQRLGKMAHVSICLFPAAVAFDGLLSRETAEAGLDWLGRSLMVLALAVLVVAAIRHKRSIPSTLKGPKAL